MVAKWPSMPLSPIVSHVFRVLESSHSNIVNTFARTNVCVSVHRPSLPSTRVVDSYIFTNSFSSECAINQCLSGHRRLRRRNNRAFFLSSVGLCRRLFVIVTIRIRIRVFGCARFSGVARTQFVRSVCVWHFVLFSREFTLFAFFSVCVPCCGWLTHGITK